MACSSSKDTNPQVLAGTIARNIFTAFFSDDRWQNSFVSIFMGSWDDFKNGVVSVPEPTSAEKAQHKKRRAMKPPSVSRSRSPSPPSPSCDRAFVALVKQLFQDFVKTPQMQRWLANLFSKMVSIEKSNTLPLMSGRSGSGRPPKDSTDISVKRCNLDLPAINMNPARTATFRFLFEYNYDCLCKDEEMMKQFVQFCLENFEEQTDQLLGKAVEAWTHRLGCITEQEDVRASQGQGASSEVPKDYPKPVEQKKARSAQVKADRSKPSQDFEEPRPWESYRWSQKEGRSWKRSWEESDQDRADTWRAHTNSRRE